MFIGVALVIKISFVCANTFSSTKNFGAVMWSVFLFLWLKSMAIPSAAAVPSSNKLAFAIGKPVRSATIV